MGLVCKIDGEDFHFIGWILISAIPSANGRLSAVTRPGRGRRTLASDGVPMPMSMRWPRRLRIAVTRRVRADDGARRSTTLFRRCRPPLARPCFHPLRRDDGDRARGVGQRAKLYVSADTYPPIPWRPRRRYIRYGPGGRPARQGFSRPWLFCIAGHGRAHAAAASGRRPRGAGEGDGPPRAPPRWIPTTPVPRCRPRRSAPRHRYAASRPAAAPSRGWSGGKKTLGRVGLPCG